MVSTGLGDEERNNPGSVNAEAAAPEATVGESLGLGLVDAQGTANVHTEPVGEPATQTGAAGGRSVTSAEMVAALIPAGGEPDVGEADGAVAPETGAQSGGRDSYAAEGASARPVMAAPPQDGSGQAESGSPSTPRRLSKPMLAAAAIVGLILVSLPFTLTSLGRPTSPGRTGTDAAAYSSGGGGSSSGLVPSAEAPVPIQPGAPVSSSLAPAPSALPSAGGAAPAVGAPRAPAAPAPAAAAGAAPAFVAPHAPAAGPGPAAPPPANPPTGTTVVIPATHVFMPGDSVNNNIRWLRMQQDGNLVIYDQNGRALWSSNTAGRGYKAVFQADGNFVVVDRNGNTVWQPQPSTAGDNGANLVLEPDGNVTIVYHGIVVWAANTAR